MSETFDQMVDRVLAYNRTPRRHLFEYPYNKYESRELIRKAEELVRSLTVDVEKVDTLHFRPDVNRVELIEDSQRTYMNYNADQVMTSLQDDGKTLKIFLKKGNA